jgi:hypothetical protein
MGTLQELFDVSAAHLLKQRARSVSPSGRCLYRGPNGTMCAVGVLISDDNYNLRLEGRGVGHEAVLRALRDSGCPTHHAAVVLLADLQRLHDTVEEIDLWPVRLTQLAGRHGLRTDAIDAL